MSNLVANPARVRAAARSSVNVHPRVFTTSLRRLEEATAARPPPPTVDDSTSVVAYRRMVPHRPPPLPVIDRPHLRSAEEAVANIIYNTPTPGLQPFKKHVLNCLVHNEPGVLSRVSGILAGRGFNIDSLVVCRTEIRDLSKMCIVLRGQDGIVEQARRQLEDLVPIWAVLDYTDTHCIERELLLAKVSILGHEYLEEQLLGGPTHAPRSAHPTSYPSHHLHPKPRPKPSKLEREAALAQQFEHSADTDHDHDHDLEGVRTAVPLTPSEALRMKSDNLQAIEVLSARFGGRIVDVSEHSVIVEMSGKTKRVEAFLSLLKPFGLIESARTGLMVMPRTPINNADEDDAEDGGGAVDASLLPPG